MSYTNRLISSVECPRCFVTSELLVDLYFGGYSPKIFRVGDIYTWKENALSYNGGRPKDGNALGSGYTECTNCMRDFFVMLTVIRDKITSVVPDKNRVPNIPDTRITISLRIPSESTPCHGELLLYEHYSIGLYICNNSGFWYAKLESEYVVGNPYKIIEPLFAPSIQVIENH